MRALGLRIPIVVLIAGGISLGALAADSDAIYGVYKNSFMNGDVSGRAFKSENILELVKISDKTAYFRIHLEFYNGHLCALAGVAERDGNSMTYRSTQTDNHGNRCVLQIKRTETALVLDEGAGQSTCRELNCGMRGSFSGASFDLGKRRNIRYMPRLLNSQEYKSAVAEYKSGQAATHE